MLQRKTPPETLAIFRKTVKGTEAITGRLHGLVGKLRTVLILVDGKRNDAELGRLAAGLGDPAVLLSQLERDGFIERIERLPAVQADPAALAPASNLSAKADLDAPAVSQAPLQSERLQEKGEGSMECLPQTPGPVAVAPPAPLIPAKPAKAMVTPKYIAPRAESRLLTPPKRGTRA